MARTGQPVQSKDRQERAKRQLMELVESGCAIGRASTHTKIPEMGAAEKEKSG